MFEKFSEKDLLLILHKKIYWVGEETISYSKSNLVYSLLKKRLANLTEEEKKYIFSEIDEDGLAYKDKLIQFCEEKNCEIITWVDPSYPFSRLDDPPPVLIVMGELPDSSKNPYIAFVGSRKATSYGREVTQRLIEDLEPYSVTITSGFAYGIDIEAHRAAIRFGLPTVAILGCGIDANYPSSHYNERDQVIKNGAVISEFPLGTPPLPNNFPLRNRVISALSLGVVVVEAEIRSGSLITARWAAEQGKPVFAVPGNIGRILSSGTNHLIKEGAALITKGGEIAETLGLKKQVKTKSLKKNAGQSPMENGIKRTVYEFVKNGERDFDKLALLTGLKPSELLVLVTEIELTK